MKAIVLIGYGDVDKLELAEVEEPEPGPREVKVRVAVAGINPIDWKLRRGDLRGQMPLDLPAILGRDVAGEVVEVGAEVKDLERGDRVMGLVNEAYAEYVVAPEDAFAKVPDGLDYTAAGALPLVGLAGRELVEEAVDVKPGEVVLVTGAVGSVGRVAVFAAKRRGATVIAGVRTSQLVQAAALRANRVVALDDELELSRVPPLDAIADTVDGETLALVMPKLKPRGKIGSVVGEPAGARQKGFTVMSLLAHADAHRLEELGRDAVAGGFSVPVERRFPLSEARAAQRLAEEHGVGKVVLVP